MFMGWNDWHYAALILSFKRVRCPAQNQSSQRFKVWIMSLDPDAIMSEDFNQVDIPLEICHEQQNFRLLEIPSELLGLIISKMPPRYPFLP